MAGHVLTAARVFISSELILSEIQKATEVSIQSRALLKIDPV